MDLILLPGTSSKNKEWIEEVSKRLSDLFSSTHIQYYDHWAKNSVKYSMDIKQELSKLKTLAKPLKDYMIFAKSAGTLLTLLGVEQGIISPVKCVFTGFPIHFARAIGLDLANYLRSYSVPTLFIQNTNDPAMSFKDLKNFLETNKPKSYLLKELPGNAHHYGDLESLYTLTKEFITSH